MKSLRFKSAIMAAAMFVVFVGNQLSAGGGSQSGTSSAPAASSVAGKSIVRVGIQFDPGTLTPFTARNAGMVATYRSLYEYLIDRDTFGGEMVGCLMKSWKQVDNVTYQITLYDYIVDSAGNKMKASDIKFSYDTAIASGTQPKLSVIDTVSVVDQYTAAFKFKSPLALGDLEAVWSEIPVITEAAYKASPDKMATIPISTHAYKVTEVSAGSKIVLQKTGKYWQTDTSKMPLAAKSNVDTIEFHIIREAAQLVIALETGAIDITANIGNARQVSRFQPGGNLANNFTVYNYMNNPCYVLLFNCAKGNVFADNGALRQAVAYAIDTKGIVDGVFGGNAVALKAVGSSKYGDYIKAWDSKPYYEYDLAKAKSLMSQAGYPNGGLKLKLLVTNSEAIVNMATIIQGYLSQIGITAEIVPYEAAMFKSLQNDPTAYDICIDTYASTDYVVNIWKLSMDSRNYNGRTVNFITDSKLQSQIEQSSTIQGHTAANIDALSTYLNDNMYIYGLAVDLGFVVSNKRVTGILLDSRNSVIPASCSYDFSK
ncbi:MAG: ABC transporter substrate-binding protein [Spirochaetaceae bacterium]|jgi:ABC-type transport system substrate-binding protein|nr:ABC transporter substrate-binding protein [Spirochaetaceae bacterium]